MKCHVFNHRKKGSFLTIVGEIFTSAPGEGKKETGRLGQPGEDFLSGHA